MPGKKLVLSFFAVVLLLGAVPSLAAEATPEGYKEAVEPICKANTEANETILKGVKAEVKAGKLDSASKRVAKASVALKRTRTRLLAVPQPPEDAAQLTKWLGYVKTEVQLFETLARKLANDEKGAASRMVVRLYTTADQANSQVRDYGFRYCKFQPAKFL